MSKRALVVEDDANIAELLRLYLGKDGFDVMIAADGGKAESSFDLFQPDVVLLDIMLPVKDGWEVCRDIRRKSSTPIIMLTAKGETGDKISGLEMGADDYVTKPFDVKELLARIHAVMRRTDADAPVEKKLSYDKLIINLESYELIVDGKKIDTPPKERSGALTTSATREPWTCTSSVCAKSWRACPTSGASKPSGAWGTSSNSLKAEKNHTGKHAVDRNNTVRRRVFCVSQEVRHGLYIAQSARRRRAFTDVRA